ncbi:MAG: hypothetical protein AAB482_01480 [Patescibacteria group bacterium]
MRNNTTSITHAGFIALISVLIISGILIAVTTAASMSGFLSRSNMIDSELKERGKSLAEACADVALLKYAQNPSYAGNETISVGVDSCLIRSFIISGSQITIETQGIYRNTYSDIRVTADISTLAIVSWEEVSHF